MKVATTEFVTAKSGAGQIATMSGVDISHYARKERMGTHAKDQGYIPAAERVGTFCTLIKFLLALAMFSDDMEMFAAREWIAPLQARLMEVALY